MVSALKVEPISNTPVVSRLIRVGSFASFGLFGSKSGTETIDDDLAGAHIGDDAGRCDRLELVARRNQFVAHRMLHAQVDGELHRLLQPVGRKPGRMQRREPVAVEPFLDAGDALVVDIDEPDQVRDLGAVRIGALVFVEEADARNAEL